MTWDTVAVGLLAFVGAGLGGVIALVVDLRTNRWRRREETYRLLRWATEQALRDDSPKAAAAGVAALEALGASQRLLQPEDKDFIERVQREIVGHTLEQVGDDDDVVQEG